MRDDRLRWRKFKTSFSQKLLDEAFDFSFQEFFRSTGDDEVIRITDEMNTRFFTSKGLETFPCRKLFLQESSSPSSAQLASAGEIIPPWGVPSIDS